MALGYLEGIGDGQAFLAAVRGLTARKPLVLVKGGVAAEGKRAAASHTGSLASDDRVFDGVCRQLGVARAATVEEAFEWAATFATQPLPRGRRVVVFTTAGGWGVLAADACAAAGLELVALPEELRAAIDALVPARWSRNNPIDLAGGETRDTVPEVLDLICAHDRSRRRDPPRDRHPGRAGAGVPDRPLPSRLRARPDRRLSRAPGPALRRSRPPGERAPRQARPDRQRARRDRPRLRQRRPPGRQGRGAPLLPERTPGGVSAARRWSTTRSTGARSAAARGSRPRWDPSRRGSPWSRRSSGCG